jgi:hypothetical protein
MRTRKANILQCIMIGIKSTLHYIPATVENNTFTVMRTSERNMD